MSEEVDASPSTPPAEEPLEPRLSPTETEILNVGASDEGAGDGDRSDEAVNALSNELTAERTARREERFVWMVISVILIDVLWFHTSSNVSLPLIVAVLELLALVIVARRMQIVEVVELVNRLLEGLTPKAAGSK